MLPLNILAVDTPFPKPHFLIHKGKDSSDRIWPPIQDPSDIILIDASGEVLWEAEHHEDKDSEPGNRFCLNPNLGIY